MTMITQKEFEDEMREISEKTDMRERHIEATLLMCRVLLQFGYDVGVKIFSDMPKMYGTTLIVPGGKGENT